MLRRYGATGPPKMVQTWTSAHEIIELDGLAVGCVGTNLEVDHLFIDKLYIAPSFQRNGIGASVLRTIVSQAAKRGVPTMRPPPHRCDALTETSIQGRTATRG